MSILDKLSQRQQNRQQSAAEQYRKLLGRLIDADGEPSEKDVELLDNLCGVLGHDRAQVEADMETIRRLNTLVPIAGAEQQRHVNWRALMTKGCEHQKMMDAEVKRLTAEHTAVEAEAGRARSLFIESTQANKEISDLRNASKHLFQ